MKKIVPTYAEPQPYALYFDEHKAFGRPYRALELYRKQNGNCYYCEKPMKLHAKHKREPEFMTIDHKHPKVDGGTREGDNAVGACLSCNGLKKNMSAEAFKMMVRPMPLDANNK